MARRPPKTIEDRSLRLFQCFERLAAMTRDIQNLTAHGVTPGLMDSFKIVSADAPDRPENMDLLWNIPANDKAREQKFFVDRAIKIMNFTVDLMQLQISLLHKPENEVSEDIKRIIRRCINEDGEKFMEMQKEIHGVLDAQDRDRLQLHGNQLNASNVHERMASAQNEFMEIVNHDAAIAVTGNPDDQDYSHVVLHSRIANAKIPTLLSKMFDVRMEMLDHSIDIFEFKMRSAITDMARYMQWDVLRQTSSNLNNANTKGEMERSWEAAKASYPELKAGIDVMYKFFREITTTDPSTNEFRPVLNRFVMAPASDLPQITP